MHNKTRKVLILYIDDLHFRVMTCRIRTRAYPRYLFEFSCKYVKRFEPQDEKLKWSRNVHDSIQVTLLNPFYER